MYVYIKSSPTTWAVGFYTNEGERWNPESDHFSEEDARKQVAYLNGISNEKTTQNLREIENNLVLISVGINKSNAEIAELKRKIAEVEGERDALREFSVGLIESLEVAVKIYESYGFVADYLELGALVNQYKESIVLCKKVVSPEK